MGRVKLEIKKIEEKDRRAVTYLNRRKWVMKKAYELSVLCDVDIGVTIYRSSSELEFFGKRDRVDKFVARNHAKILKVGSTKVKFGNMKSVRIVQKNRDERDLEAPRVGRGELHLENEELKANHQLAAEKNLEETCYEATGRSYTKFVNSFSASPHLAKVKRELKQAWEKVSECVRQLEQEAMPKENRLQQNAYGPSNLNGGQQFGISSDGAEVLYMRNACEGLLDNIVLSSSWCSSQIMRQRL